MLYSSSYAAYVWPSIIITVSTTYTDAPILHTSEVFCGMLVDYNY